MNFADISREQWELYKELTRADGPADVRDIIHAHYLKHSDWFSPGIQDVEQLIRHFLKADGKRKYIKTLFVCLLGPDGIQM